MTQATFCLMWKSVSKVTLILLQKKKNPIFLWLFSSSLESLLKMSNVTQALLTKQFRFVTFWRKHHHMALVLYLVLSQGSGWDICALLGQSAVKVTPVPALPVTMWMTQQFSEWPVALFSHAISLSYVSPLLPCLRNIHIIMLASSSD